jgi:hypothetical protein
MPYRDIDPFRHQVDRTFGHGDFHRHMRITPEELSQQRRHAQPPVAGCGTDPDQAVRRLLAVSHGRFHRVKVIDQLLGRFIEGLAGIGDDDIARIA